MTTPYTICPLRYSALTHREFESLMTDSQEVIAKFAKTYKGELMYITHLEVFNTKIAQYQAQLASIDQKQKINMTSVDKERDAAVKGLFTVHKGFANMKLALYQGAYETLRPVFIKYKDITKHGHDAATAEIKSLLKTLKEDTYQTAVTHLRLLPMVQALTSAQAAYEKVEAMAKASKATKEVGKTKQVRTELAKTYDLLVRYTAISVEAFPEKAYFATLLKELNALRDRKRHLTTTIKKTKTEPAVVAV